VIFFDASAAAKRYFLEIGSDMVAELWHGPEFFSSLTILHCELMSAVNRKLRERAISQAAFRSLKTQIGHDLRKLHAVPVDAGLIEIVLSLLDSHPLKAVGALYLAGALSLKRATREPVLFVSADRQLLRAAAGEGLRTLDPEKAG
jgi:predicted nucleic acid-binding protein